MDVVFRFDNTGDYRKMQLLNTTQLSMSWVSEIYQTLPEHPAASRSPPAPNDYDLRRRDGRLDARAARNGRARLSRGRFGSNSGVLRAVSPQRWSSITGPSRGDITGQSPQQSTSRLS
jgi:hypothetical protein